VVKITEEGLRAHREKVDSSWFWIRWLGVALVILGAVFAVGNYNRGWGHGSPLEIGALIVTVAGWALILVAFRMRNAYQSRRKL
jgi:protein-S-isoprenylcysteine O-methyltransferase Ste14